MRGPASAIPFLAAVALALMAILTSCQGRPDDGVALSLYHRNLSGQSYSYRVLGTPPGTAGWLGPVPDVVSSSGCGFVGRDWELIVVEGDAPPGPADEFAAHVTADDFGGADPIAIALSIKADGAIAITQGVPEWWDSDIQRCP
jgi:hypothetical protein